MPKEESVNTVQAEKIKEKYVLGGLYHWDWDSQNCFIL